ncbi:MAG: hypothetical protein ABJB05_02190 [Parafilimonas sp.]
MKNDDMDDMFKKAADEYDLNDELAYDWNKVNNSINKPEETLPLQPKQKKRKRLILLFWLLLIPVALLTIYKTALFISSNKQQNKPATEAQKVPNNSDKQLNNTSKNLNNIQKNKQITGIKIKPVITIKSTSSVVLKSTFTNNKNSKAALLKTSASVKNTDFKNDLNNKDADNLSAIESQQNVYKNLSVESTKTTGNIFEKEDKAKNNDTTLLQQVAANDSTLQISKSKKKSIKNQTRESYVYAGAIANSDVSFIKNQKTSAPALGAGLLAGYHFKNGISIETGLLFEKKNYYTAGKFFDKSKLGYLQNADLLTANGNCNMFEIPLNIKYDFTSHKKYNWFVTAGASSYLMSKEFYNFKYNYNGNTGERGYYYYHSSKNLFSVLNFGAGVNIQTSKKYFIQVQPYYKTPLQGVGIGNLRLSSAGINFSVTRRIP